MVIDNVNHVPLDAEYLLQLESSLELYQERIAELEFASEDIGWTQLGGTAEYEFSRDHLRKMFSRSRLFFLQNPLIRRAVSLQADYVFAQGLSIQGTNQVVNRVIQDFLDDPGNKREFASHQSRLLKEQTLQLDGNVFFILFTDKTNTGNVNIRSVLVDQIVDIITNPDDSNEIWFYKREWYPTNESGIIGELQTAYYPDIDYMPRDVNKLPATRNDKKIYWDAPILHVKTGALAKSKFGAPETYSALEWAKAHSKMLADWATIISMYARFAFKLTTPGNKQSIVAARQRLGTTVGNGIGETNPSPTVGSTFIRNKDGVDIEPVKTSGATTSAKDARELRIMVAAAMGLPDPMLSGEVDVGNLATAKTLDRPTELRFRSRQKLWEDVTHRIIDWVLRWAILAPKGKLRTDFKFDNKIQNYIGVTDDPGTGKPIDLHVEVVFPPILERTIQERIDAVIGAVTLNGKTFALDSPELKKLTIRLMLQALGLSDIDEVVEQIFKNLPDTALQGPQKNGQQQQQQQQPEIA